MKALPIIALVTVLICLAPLCAQAGVARAKSFTLWQLPEQTHSQMMSYVVRTPGGKVIVIDGGTAGDAPYLREFLTGLGGKVDAWFLSHPHSDHVDAPVAILGDPQGLKIDRVYASMPDVAWIEKYELPETHTVTELNAVLKMTGRTAIELPLGAELIFDGVHFDVLSVKNPEIHGNCINNSSVVLRVSDAGKSVLFLGDLGPEAGQKMLQGPYASKMKSDYCQMAHHGQSGVHDDVYSAVHPKYCLWTTPKWLWDNDTGGGKGSGPWTTLETRKWAEEMGVKRNYVTWIDGLVRID